MHLFVFLWPGPGRVRGSRCTTTPPDALDIYSSRCFKAAKAHATLANSCLFCLIWNCATRAIHPSRAYSTQLLLPTVVGPRGCHRPDLDSPAIIRPKEPKPPKRPPTPEHGRIAEESLNTQWELAWPQGHSAPRHTAAEKLIYKRIHARRQDTIAAAAAVSHMLTARDQQVMAE